MLCRKVREDLKKVKTLAAWVSRKREQQEQRKKLKQNEQMGGHECPGPGARAWLLGFSLGGLGGQCRVSVEQHSLRRREEPFKSITLGAPGWLTQLSVRLLISAQVVVSGP